MSRTLGRVWGFGAVLSLLLSGCGEDREPPAWRGSSSEPERILGCEEIDHASCDVREAACEERLLALAICLRRDEDAPLPPVTLMSESELEAYLYDLAAEEPELPVNHLERGLVGLGMVEPGALAIDTVVSELVKGIGGIFRHDADDILIIDHGDNVDRNQMSSILVHEFIHYLQDRDIDLGAYQAEYAVSSDTVLAAMSLVEGEAELHQLRYYAALLGYDPNQVDYRATFDELVTTYEEYLLSLASPYSQVRSAFPYAWGGRYMQEAWDNGGLDGVLERFASPPTQTRTLMAVAAGDAITTAETEAVAPASPDPPAGFSRFSEDVGGAFMLFLYLATLTTPDDARAQALDWRGDRLSIYASDDDGTTALVWRFSFVNEAAAQRFATTARRRLPNDQVVFEGTRGVAIAYANADMSFDWAFTPS